MFELLEDFRYARWVKRLNRTAQVLLSLLLVAGLNYVAARHFKRWDLTPAHRYSLSPETLAFLNQSVRENMQHTPDKSLELILVSRGQMNEDDQLRRDQIFTLLKEYEYAAKSLPGGAINLKIEEVDPDRQLDAATQLQKYSPLIDLPMVMVKYGDVKNGDDRVRVLNSVDLYHVEKDASGKGLDVKDFCGENAITSAILDVVQTKADKIYFTQGHGEWPVKDTSTMGLSDFGDALIQRNYKLANINLAGLDDIPADATAVVIVLPSTSRSAFSSEEQEKLRRYLNQRNGRVLLFLSVNTNPTQNYGLEDLLREWGLRSPNQQVVEADAAHLEIHGLPVFTPVEEPKPRYHLITQQLALTVQSVVMGLLRPVEVDPQAADEAQHQVHELLATSKNSWLYPPNATKDSIPFQHGAKVIAAISEKRASDAVDLPGGKLLVYGSPDIITNNLFAAAANRTLIVNSVNYLANHEHMLNIRPLAPKESKLEIPTAQFEGLGWRLALLPAAMALFGLGMCWLRYRS